ncbi:SAM-dependent methyltransferase [Pseudonocardia acaciae]|uniref:SAM-dependent methyltransferase n=1 Tax=Pseudonocardia acaciae TaxID=551276 RepID=UPI00055CE32E|nr:SAM-dependent methyltransferase [Pseudonocardia acaciae]
MVDEIPQDLSPELAAKIRFDVPNSARTWNYLMGGKDHYPADRAAGEAFVERYPEMVVMAKQARQFLIRMVRFLARDAGIRQFLDIGTGLPTMQNTHEVAQSVAPESKVVYVDNDPVVLAHARALLTNTTPEGVTAYIDADVHDPDLIVSDARNLLNFNQPVAVMFMGLLGHVVDDEEMHSIVARVMDAVPSGSYLVNYEGTNTSRAYVETLEGWAKAGAAPYVARSPEQIGRLFDGMEMVDPGVVPVSRWRPEAHEVGAVPPFVDAFGAVARKP